MWHLLGWNVRKKKKTSARSANTYFMPVGNLCLSLWGVLEHGTCGCHFLGFAVFTVQVNSEISFTL